MLLSHEHKNDQLKRQVKLNCLSRPMQTKPESKNEDLNQNAKSNEIS